jgi:hypothetical protein
VPCAQGSYKAGFANDACAECPEGWTTEPGVTAKTAASDCTCERRGWAVEAEACRGLCWGSGACCAAAAPICVLLCYAAARPHSVPHPHLHPHHPPFPNPADLLRGYAAPAGQLDASGVPAAAAALCPAGTYRDAPALYDAAANATGLACTPCPGGLQTQDAGAADANACLAPPGWGFDGAAASPCARGSYSQGWNRDPCIPCGAGNWTSDDAGSTTPDACAVPAGHGAEQREDGVFVAAPCPVGTYGRDRASYGLYSVECTKCVEATTTAAPGASSPLHCVTLPGYGWGRGGSERCEFAYWSPGGGQEPCQYCGEGYNTTASAGGTAPAAGADAAGDCAVAAGWTPDGRGGVKPCMQGFYKSLLGDSPCVRCPAGTTTTLTFAPAALSDCDACRPGFGAAAIDPASPACGLCGSGTYAFGYVQGGAACEACPKPDGYDGRMVSRRVGRPRNRGFVGGGKGGEHNGGREAAAGSACSQPPTWSPPIDRSPAPPPPTHPAPHPPPHPPQPPSGPRLARRLLP